MHLPNNAVHWFSEGLNNCPMNEEEILVQDFEAFESHSSVHTSLLIQSSFNKRLSMLDKVTQSIFIDRNQFFLQEKNWKILLKTLMFLGFTCYLNVVFIVNSLYLGIPIFLAVVFINMLVVNFI